MELKYPPLDEYKSDSGLVEEPVVVGAPLYYPNPDEFN